MSNKNIFKLLVISFYLIGCVQPESVISTNSGNNPPIIENIFVSNIKNAKTSKEISMKYFLNDLKFIIIIYFCSAYFLFTGSSFAQGCCTADSSTF